MSLASAWKRICVASEDQSRVNEVGLETNSPNLSETIGARFLLWSSFSCFGGIPGLLHANEFRAVLCSLRESRLRWKSNSPMSEQKICQTSFPVQKNASEKGQNK